MTNILTKIKELHELEKKAAPIPWVNFKGFTPPTIDNGKLNYLRMESDGGNGEVIGFNFCDKEEDKKHFCNPEFIVEMRNSLQEILQCLEESLEIIKENHKHYLDRVPKHREYDRLDLHGNFLEKWGIK